MDSFSWIPDLQSSGFRTPLAEMSRILDSSSNVSWIPESGLAYMGRDSSCMQAVAIGLIVRTVPCRITGDFIWPTRSPEHFWRRIESRDSLGNHYFFKQCTELMFMWCTTPPLHNFSIFPNREIQRSFKHTAAFFFYLTEMLKCWRCLWPACVMILTTGAPQILSRCLR